jgi:acyl carrier protein
LADLEPLRDFILKEFLFGREVELADGDPLFPDVVDSLGVMQVVEFVEENYSITLAEDELLADNFRSLEAIGALVDRNRDGA